MIINIFSGKRGLFIDDRGRVSIAYWCCCECAVLTCIDWGGMAHSSEMRVRARSVGWTYLLWFGLGLFAYAVVGSICALVALVARSFYQLMKSGCKASLGYYYGLSSAGGFF